MRVLLPIAEEPYTEAQVDFVGSYRWPKDTEIKVLHVMHSVMIERTMVSSQIYIDQIMKDARKLADKAAEETMANIKKVCPDLKVSKELKEGDAIHEIIAVAEEWKANMIVMGSHGRLFEDDEAGPVLLCSDRQLARDRVAATDVHDLLLGMLRR